MKKKIKARREKRNVQRKEEKRKRENIKKKWFLKFIKNQKREKLQKKN